MCTGSHRRQGKKKFGMKVYALPNVNLKQVKMKKLKDYRTADVTISYKKQMNIYTVVQS